MSANNYMLIHRVGGKYYVWDNLMAEEATSNPPLSIRDAKEFTNLEKAIKWANLNDETEYGYQINELSRPKDGFQETIRELRGN